MTHNDIINSITSALANRDQHMLTRTENYVRDSLLSQSEQNTILLLIETVAESIGEIERLESENEN